MLVRVALAAPPPPPVQPTVSVSSVSSAASYGGGGVAPGEIVVFGLDRVVDLLRLHGIEMERIPKALDGEFETYRFSNIRFAQSSVEGHVAVNFDTRTVKEHIVLPAGSCMAMLEPEAPDSLARWGLMNPVFETGFDGRVGDYLSEPIARRMMADNPELRQQFEARLAADPKFAGDPRAPGVVVSAFEVRAGRHRPVSDRENLAKVLVGPGTGPDFLTS